MDSETYDWLKAGLELEHAKLKLLGQEPEFMDYFNWICTHEA